MTLSERKRRISALRKINERKRTLTEYGLRASSRGYESVASDVNSMQFALKGFKEQISKILEKASKDVTSIFYDIPEEMTRELEEWVIKKIDELF